MSRSLRGFERVSAAIPVHLDGGAKGETLNLSPGGLFFVTDKEMAVGSAIRFTIQFAAPSGKFYLECEGEIVRVERADQRIGLAAKITESRLERRPVSAQGFVSA